jgi:hypothetical protein
MQTVIDPLEVVARIEPAVLSQLADDSYARCRHHDLTRAFAEDAPQSAAGLSRRHGSHHARRRWTVPATAVAVAGAAAAAAVTVAASPTAGSPRSHAAALDARAFLLTGADIATRAPAATGTYWYVRERDFEPTAPRSKDTSFGASYAATQESWLGQSRARTIVDEKLTFTFASPADQARWRAAGAPKLAGPGVFGNGGPSTTNYASGFRWGLGNYRLSMAAIQRLPGTTSALGETLYRMWKSLPDKAAAVGLPHPTFGQYLVQWADILLTGPATPATRSAIYQLLAGQPRLRIVNAVTDPQGRTGIAIGDGGGDFLIIDPSTAELLAYASGPVRSHSAIPSADGVEVYDAMGWTSRLGVPAS